MSKVFIEESSLISIGDAIRAKTGKSDLLSPAAMVTEIESIEAGSGGSGGGYYIPPEIFELTGDCTSKFAYGANGWMLELYPNEFSSYDITSADRMFEQSGSLTTIPFDLNFSTDGTEHNLDRVFSNCSSLTSIGAINDAKPLNMDCMFEYCHQLREVPTFNNLDLSEIDKYDGSDSVGWHRFKARALFAYCRSLRSVPEEWLKQIRTPYGQNWDGHICEESFAECFALDEIKGISPETHESIEITSDMFSNTFRNCERAKEITFKLQEDGTPYTVKWANQNLRLTDGVGWSHDYNGRTLSYNSGITADKYVYDADTYAALKNDADWFTDSSHREYSRYNHDSAVNTINSLPDTSAYGSNTITFNGNDGSATDGGAINTLTEAEIAVAVAKGWTVNFE